uniref:Uncharacterized protein n=1 Tax=Anguilla anguilla TaxID=7936 RepID=A0A0E9WCK6_ANGAN
MSLQHAMVDYVVPKRCKLNFT